LIDINCDMGEGMGNEEALMPFINSANIACGYHAGDDATMQQVIELCLNHQVHIGAHPSFPDRKNFGRSEMQLSFSEIYSIVTDQLLKLNEIVKRNGGLLHHIKPHGALYNMAAKNTGIAHVIARAVKDFDSSLIYYGLSGSNMIIMAKEQGLQVANEVFADRTYQSDGSLTPRSLPDALHLQADEVLKQVMKFVKENKVRTVDGDEIIVKADTICIHGDGIHALEFAKAIYEQLDEK
jgi:UPF0271 protein